jgi:hypothetical protein
VRRNSKPSRTRGGKHARRRPHPRRRRVAVSVAFALALGVGGVLSLETWDAAKAPAASSDDYSPAALPLPPGDNARTQQSPRDSRVGPGATDEEVPDQGALPADSGTGRRVVFSQGAQRTWLVDAAGRVLSTYLVSGSVLDNLDPGSYEVYSRSRWAVGVDDSGVMEYMVRFTRGARGVPIGFHTIPTRNGVPLQTTAQLGTPQSHGCIRQRVGDAKRLWRFAEVGTPVVVVSGD